MPQEKLWGLIWNKGTGGQDTAIQNKQDNEIIIAYHKSSYVVKFVMLYLFL